VRSLSHEASVRASLTHGGATASELARLSFVAASLENDDGWADAVRGCEYVHHVASPFPSAPPKHEDDLIVPARDGALRLLRAAVDASVKRVVLTSSANSVDCGHPPGKDNFTEKDWSILDGPVKAPAYKKSKTIAERAAWAFINSDANIAKTELTTIIPTLILGPALGEHFSMSVEVIKKLVDGSMPGAPKLLNSVVDVRDIAAVHVLAMTTPAAAGERFIVASNEEPASMLELGQIIMAKRPEHSKKIPTFELPNLMVYAISFFDKSIGLIVPNLGAINRFSNQKARTTFGWQPRTLEQTVLDTVDSLVKNGLI
jgi:nucleoside-diphosphate-sugar epimerase